MGSQPPPEPKSFFAQLPGVFVYPIRGRGKTMIIVGAVFFWLVGFLTYFPIVGILVGAGIAGYLCAFMIKIIGASAAGEKDLPDWPDVTNFLDDILRPLFLVVGTLVFSFLPLLIYYFASDTSWVWEVLRQDVLFWILVGVGLLYMPMGLVAVALFDSLSGLNPLIVLVGIIKVAPAYIVACAVLFLCVALRSAIGASLAIPIVGAILDGVVSLYLLMVEMRVLGLIYHSYERRLDWFPGS